MVCANSEQTASKPVEQETEAMWAGGGAPGVVGLQADFQFVSKSLVRSAK